ncbi:MAG TPA: hypothetical protein VJ922_00440 [Actinomycetota bacterium]|nr:hypothetical protein [Actinomycetota bacterium]
MRRITSTALILGLLFAFVAFGAPGAVAQTVGTADKAVDRELVSIRTNADGGISRIDLVDALSVYGDGRVRIVDRNSSVGLRNLIGFEGPAAVSGSTVTWDLDVKGSKEMLTVAQRIKPTLPVSVQPTYFMGDRLVKAAEMRGYTGEIAIEYRLANTTRRTENLEITNAAGLPTTAPIDTYVPFVAQASFELTPDVWERIDAPGASVVTDDQQIRHVTYTAILAPVVGTAAQTIRLAGRVRNFEMGETRVVFQPLLPGNADTVAEKTVDGSSLLYAGVGTIDANLGKLQEGTLQLVDGLSQLYAGIVEARSGIGDVGTSDTIVDGLNQVLDGLESLGDSKAGVPAIKAGVDELASGIEEILVGLGSTGQPGTILGGLSAIDAGLGTLAGASGLGAIKTGIDGAAAGVGQLAATLGTAPGAPGAPSASTTLSNDIQFLKNIAGSAASLCDAYAAALGQPSCTASSIGAATMTAVGDGAQQKVDGIRTCMTTGGVPGACAGTEPNGISEGLSALSAGTQSAISSIGTPASPPTTMRGGMALVLGGLQEIKAGLKSGNPNSPGVIEGLDAVADGLTQVISGIGTVGTADTLTDGASRLLSGSQDLADGVDQIAAGTSDAQSGAAQIGDGQGQLSERGTKQIQAGIGGGLQDASSALALLESMKKRAADESFVYGPPEGAEGSTTYVFRIGEISRRNFETIIKLGIGAVMLALLMTAGVAAVRRPA